MTEPTSEAVAAAVQRDFGDRSPQARAALDRIDAGNWLVDRLRLEAAVIDLARGDQRELERMVGVANVDWRDVLYWQELAEQDDSDR